MGLAGEKGLQQEVKKWAGLRAITRTPRNRQGGNGWVKGGETKSKGTTATNKHHGGILDDFFRKRDPQLDADRCEQPPPRKRGGANPREKGIGVPGSKL